MLIKQILVFGILAGGRSKLGLFYQQFISKQYT